MFKAFIMRTGTDSPSRHTVADNGTEKVELCGKLMYVMSVPKGMRVVETWAETSR